MKLSDYGIEIKNSGKTTCPKCSNERKNKKDKCLSVDVERGIWNCHNCGWKGGLFEKLEKVYDKPVWTNNTNLSENLVKWFSSRGVSQQTLLQLKISESKEFMPQQEKEVNCICFNYFRNEELINIKYRDGVKNFKMFKGAELIFYNLDGIKESNTCIIVEGEMDCLSLIECGINEVVSVPNGASKGNNKLEYLDNCWEYFENKSEVIIATDNDNAGISLRNELARRIGFEKCVYIDFNECKDANEYLLQFGKIKLSDLIKTGKKDFPVSGVIYAKDFYDDIDDLYYNGFPKSKKLELGEIDNYLSFDEGSLVVVTGIPNHGKSEMIDFLAIVLNIKHDWKFAIFSPENYPLKYHFSKLSEKVIGKRFHGNDRMNEMEKEKSKEYINDNFFFIRPDNETFSIETILEKAKILVKKRGIKSLIIDPYNRLEHQIPSGVSETNYISKILDKIIDFKQKYGVTIFLIAHPTKIKKDKSTLMFEVPNLYDISGSSNFFNKADIGLTIYRDFKNNKTELYIQKVRFKHCGQVGKVDFTWNETNGRYVPDNKNWLEPIQKQEELFNPNKFIEPNINFENEHF